VGDDVRPNLFSHATSELSQDAVLCWLLKWSDPSHSNDDVHLHRLGSRLVTALFHCAGKHNVPAGRVEILRQIDGMDIVALIGVGDVILIEDKIHSSEHSNQLERYREAIKRLYPERDVLPVYLKTGEQASFDGAEAAGWHVFKRRDLLAVLRTAGDAQSDVIRDFRDHLERLQSEVASFKTLPPKSWQGLAWQGFFEVVKEKFPDARWNYVANQNGGFMGLWWSWHSVPGGQLYLQLEQDHLVAKVEPEADDSAERAVLRDRWSHRVIAEVSPLRFSRPPRFGNGATMTVAVSIDPYLQLKPDGLLDLDATLEVLRKAAAGISSLARRRG
jgi:hypothetical protein